MNIFLSDISNQSHWLGRQILNGKNSQLKSPFHVNLNTRRKRYIYQKSYVIQLQDRISKLNLNIFRSKKNTPVCSWIFRLLFIENVSLQTVHTYGFSPVFQKKKSFLKFHSYQAAFCVLYNKIITNTHKNSFNQ